MKLIEVNELRKLQYQNKNSLMETLDSIELNVTEICNRTCKFCPRGDPIIYPNTKDNMSLEIVEVLSKQLKQIDFKNKVSLVGYGEPLLYKNLIPAVSIIRQNLPNLKWLEVMTNGDFLTKDIATSLANAGCTAIIISMYDEDISEKIIDMVKDVDISIGFKHCYENKLELKLVNRTNVLTKEKPLNLNKPCNIPFYKTLIDYNGDVILCANDWNRHGKLGNILEESIDSIWLGEKMKEYRTKLLQGKRESAPCGFCNVDGELYGSESVEIFKKYYAGHTN